MKEVEDFSNENFTPLGREFDEDCRIWNDFSCSSIGSINILPIIIITKCYYTKNIIDLMQS